MGLLSTTALESIDFQSDSLFKELTLAFADLKKVKESDISDHELGATLGSIVKHRTGAVVVFVFGKIQPCIEIPQVDKNHPLLHPLYRDYASNTDGLKLIREAGGMARGGVDLNKSTVAGAFTRLSATIHMPVSIIKGEKFAPEELAAITLHELGHLFVYFEFMSRTVSTNQVLAGLSKALDGSDVPQREVVLVEVKKALRLSELDVEKLAKSDNKKVTEVVVLSSVARQATYELGSNIYDLNSWEYLADQFATRHGAGRYVVTALDKIYRGAWNISFRSLPAYLAMEALKLALVIVLPALALFLMAVDGSGDSNYDTPGARFKRLRNQIVENLKDKTLSKDDQERLAADLVAIDDVMKSVEDRRQVAAVIWDSLIPSARRARNQELLQKELEAIAANDLFVKAAELKQLG